MCDNDPTFVLYRISQRFGLPVVPEWAGWFNEELNRRGAIKSLIGLGCSPLLVNGTKKLFLKWIRLALRQNRIEVPVCNGPVCWNLAHSFFPFPGSQALSAEVQRTGTADCMAGNSSR